MVAKIAVVNHDPVFLRLMDRILKSDGYEPIICPSGTAAHDIIVSEQPDLIMIDTWLEDREAGWALLQTLMLDDTTKDIPILLCSSDSEEVARRLEQLKDIATLTIVAKPFDPDKLLAKVREVLA